MRGNGRRGCAYYRCILSQMDRYRGGNLGKTSSFGPRCGLVQVRVLQPKNNIAVAIFVVAAGTGAGNAVLVVVVVVLVVVALISAALLSWGLRSGVHGSCRGGGGRWERFRGPRSVG